jgi:hypothetical protein
MICSAAPVLRWLVVILLANVLIFFLFDGN